MPQLKAKSLPAIIVAVSSIAAFGLLYGGNWLLTSRTITMPVEAALHQVQGVSEVRVGEANGKLAIEVRLSSVPDLRATYLQLTKRVQEISSKRKFDLTVIDRRNPKLEEAYYGIHFDIQQAIATGGFSQMAQSISEKSPSLGIERYRVFVDQSSIYVQLHAGNDYLYEIVPRPDITAGRSSAALSFTSLGFWE